MTGNGLVMIWKDDLGTQYKALLCRRLFFELGKTKCYWVTDVRCRFQIPQTSRQLWGWGGVCVNREGPETVLDLGGHLESLCILYDTQNYTNLIIWIKLTF